MRHAGVPPRTDHIKRLQLGRIPLARFLLDRSEAWQTLRLALSCALAWAIGAVFGLSEAYWALITTVVVTKPLLPQTIAKGRERIVGTLIGAAVGFVVLVLAQHGWPKIPLFCVAFVLTAAVVAKVPEWRLAGVALIVVVLIPSSDSAYWRPFDRVLQIVIGSLSAAVVAFVLRPKHIRTVAPGIAPQDDEKDDAPEGRVGAAR